MKYIKLFFLAVLPFLFSQCKNKGEYSRVLDEFESLVYTKPDSVLKSLNSIILNPYLLSKSDYYRYILLSVQAKDKTEKDIHLDTLIYGARDFFVTTKDMRRAALASLYAGRVLQINKKQGEAFQEFNRANEYTTHFEDNNLKGLIYSSIGFLFLEQSLWTESRIYLKQALNYYLIDNDHANIIICNNLLGNTYLLKQENDSALYYYNEAKNRAIHTLKNRDLTYVNHSMGLAYLRIGKLDEAKELFYESLALQEDSVDVSQTYLCLSDIYLQEKNNVTAQNYVLRAITWLPQGRTCSNLAMSLYFKAAKVSEVLNLHSEALKYYKKYNTALIAYYKENKNTALLDLESRYKNEQLRSENQILILNKQKNILIGSLVGFLFLGLFAYLIKRYQSNKKLLSVEKRRRIDVERKIRETEIKIKHLQEMSLNFTEKENSFRSIVLHQFNILKKSADLDRYVKNNNVQELRLVKMFHKIVYKQEELNWDLLYETMNELNDRFFDKLKDKYPMLNDQEFKICCLTYADFSSSEIGLILDLKINTVQMKRSQIRKRIGMEPQENFKLFFDRSLV